MNNLEALEWDAFDKGARMVLEELLDVFGDDLKATDLWQRFMNEEGEE